MNRNRYRKTAIEKETGGCVAPKSLIPLATSAKKRRDPTCSRFRWKRTNDRFLGAMTRSKSPCPTCVGGASSLPLIRPVVRHAPVHVPSCFALAEPNQSIARSRVASKKIEDFEMKKAIAPVVRCASAHTGSQPIPSCSLCCSRSPARAQSINHGVKYYYFLKLPLGSGKGAPKRDAQRWRWRRRVTGRDRTGLIRPLRAHAVFGRLPAPPHPPVVTLSLRGPGSASG